MATFDEKRRARLEIMHRLYQLSDGFPGPMVSLKS